MIGHENLASQSYRKGANPIFDIASETAKGLTPETIAKQSTHM
jgi:hypothetical protein